MFHAHSGWYFRREPSGGVLVEKRNADEVEVGAVFPAEMWASVVASVSAAGENRETFDAALALHFAVATEETTT